MSGVLSATVAILTFIILPAPQPLGGFDSSSILILSLPILLGPELGMAITCFGEFLGTALLLAVFGGLPYYLPGIVAVRGPEAYIVGRIARRGFLRGARRYRRELLAASLGPVWETVGFIVANYFMAYLILGPEGALGYVGILSLTILDLIWVAPAMLVVAYVRQFIKADYLEEQLGLGKADRTKRALFRASLAFILICWVLLLLVPFVFIKWFSP